MAEAANSLVMNSGTDVNEMMDGGRSPEDERVFRKQRLAAALRIFGRFGFDEGVAGHFYRA